MPQFELEPKTAYFESYSDTILSGAVVTKLATFGGILTGSRTSLGSHVSGARDGYLRSLTDFGAYANAFSGSQGRTGFENHSSLVVSHFQAGTQWFDTCMPSMEDVMNLDAKGVVLTNIPNSASITLYPNPLTFACLFSVYENGSLLRVTSAVGGAALSSDYWVTTPPFAGRYRNAVRLQTAQTRIDRVQYYASCAFTNIGTVDPLGGWTTTRRETGDITLLPADPFWSGLANGVVRAPPPGFSPAYVLAPRGFNQSPIAACVVEVHQLISFTGSVTTDYVFSTSFPGPVGKTPPPYWYVPYAVSSAYGGPSPTDVIRHLYGFGYGPNNIPWFTSHEQSLNASNTGQILRYGSVIRGWKYGVANGFPVAPKAIYRRGRFGQLRDLLEPRLYTKTVDTVTNITDGPIFITFLAGTQAFLTASDPSLNTRDSGIYDAEYRSGQPFTDV